MTTQAIKDALVELVEVKKLKDRYLAMNCKARGAPGKQRAALRAEYERRKPLAWAKAWAALVPGTAKVTDNMVYRFLQWPLPKTFAPDCGISFDGRKDDEWNKDKTWPIGTNLLTAEEARAMLEYVLGEE